jgi:uncharacterized membrane protein (UPF0127 family)
VSVLNPATPRGRVALALALAVMGLVMLVLGALLLFDFGPTDARSVATNAPTIDAALANAQPAGEPFTGLSTTVVRVGSARLAVVVADDLRERAQGLRGRSSLEPYDGQLFVFDAPTRGAFTMSGVPVALDVGFFDADGRRVDTLRMQPCSGSEASCPTYVPDEDYRYAVETLAGRLPGGDLSG